MPLVIRLSRAFMRDFNDLTHLHFTVSERFMHGHHHHHQRHKMFILSQERDEYVFNDTIFVNIKYFLSFLFFFSNLVPVCRTQVSQQVEADRWEGKTIRQV